MAYSCTTTQVRSRDGEGVVLLSEDDDRFPGCIEVRTISDTDGSESPPIEVSIIMVNNLNNSGQDHRVGDIVMLDVDAAHELVCALQSAISMYLGL